MRVLLAASEVVGFAKTGGLADVAGALPRALAQRGHECAIIMPLYRCAATGKVPLEKTSLTFSVQVGQKLVTARLWRGTLPASRVPVYLVEQPDYFERDNPALARGLYQFMLSNGTKRDYPDNCERFTFFSRAVLEAVPLLDFTPDVLHLNDWQTGLVPALLAEEYRRRPPWARLRTLFTIHNIAYQGVFRPGEFPLTRLDWRLYNYEQMEFYGQWNMLKTGIVFSDMLTTVSPRYAREIQTSAPGCGGFGLEGVLRGRGDRLCGILNGIDTAVWDPATDPNLAARYDADTVTTGKPLCKQAIQRQQRLPEQPGTPLLGVVSRLAEQKGINLLGQIAHALLQLDTHLVILGTGDPAYHQMLLELQATHPNRVGLTLSHDEALAHQIEAGADMFLMPSWFEPCGLNQMYSLRYGTVPVVRNTGGLADSVVDCTPESLAGGTATGFLFGPFTGAAFLDAIKRGLELYRERPDQWRQMIRTGMKRDSSWDNSAAEYERSYERLLALPGAG